MELKEYLMSLTHWRSFSTYPDQGSSIYLHCAHDSIHKFVKVKKFNAVYFDPQEISKKFTEKLKWQFSWLPAQQIENDYDNRTDDKRHDDGNADTDGETQRHSEGMCSTGNGRDKREKVSKRPKGRQKKEVLKR